MMGFRTKPKFGSSGLDRMGLPRMLIGPQPAMVITSDAKQCKVQSIIHEEHFYRCPSLINSRQARGLYAGPSKNKNRLDLLELWPTCATSWVY